MSQAIGERLPLVKLKLLVVNLVAFGALLAAACGGGGSGQGDADAFLKMLPGDAKGMLYVNMTRLQEDGDLLNFRRMVEGQLDDDFSSDYGISPGDVTYIAFAEVGNYDVYVFGGAGNGEALRNVLQDRGYREKEIRGVEVWERASEDWEAFAFLPNGSVLLAEDEGLMEDLLRRRDRSTSSLYDEISDVMSPLSTETAMLVTPYCSFSSDCVFEGISFEKESSWDFKLKTIIAFESEDNAEEAHDHWDPVTTTNTHCYNEKLSRAGSSVTYEVICDMQDLDKVYLIAFGF